MYRLMSHDIKSGLGVAEVSTTGDCAKSPSSIVELQQEVADLRRRYADLLSDHNRQEEQCDFLNALLAGRRELIHVSGADGRWLLLNQAALKFFKLEAVAWRGSTHAELESYLPEYLLPVLKAFAEGNQQVLMTGRSLTKEIEIETPEGTIRWLEVSKSPIRDKEGQIKAVVAIGCDVTQRKRNEALACHLSGSFVGELKERTQAFNQSYARLREFFKCAPIGLVVSNPTGRIIEANQAFFRMLGTEAVENKCGQLIQELDGCAAFAFLVDAVHREGFIKSRHLRLNRVGGAPVDVLVDAVAIKEAGQAVRLDWFFRNITERVKLETRILEASERERQAIGSELHDELGQMLHGINFLSGELLERMRFLGREEVGEFERITGKMDEALKAVRSLAHGMQPVDSGPKGLMNSLQSLARDTAETYKIDCRFLAEAPMAAVDSRVATNLYRIAQEAVTNALKHSGCTQIEIRLRQAAHQSILEVADNGLGLRTGGGSRPGVGLKVMRSRALAIGAELSIEQRPNKGTVVCCTLINEQRARN